MLHFIIGSSGSGKTRAVYEKIISESIKHPDRQFFVLVPEQASLEAQKALVRLHPNKGIMNTDALSFMRLSHRIFAETGRKQRVKLDDAGKTLIVKRVLSERAKELKYFAANAGRRGFCIEMKSVISELMQYGVDAEKLQKMLTLSEKGGSGKSLLVKKLRDVAVVYEGFMEYVSDNFISPEEIYDVLADAIYDSKTMKGATVALDGYTGFTPSQYRLLSALFSQCRDVYITITMDPLETGRMLDEHELFYLSFRTMQRLEKIAEEAGCEVAEPVVLGRNGDLPRFRSNPAMADFERRIFENGRTKHEPLKESVGSPIEIKAAANPKAEVEALCCEIKAAVREGLRYREMAVITGAMDVYAPIISTEFERAGIPGFLDFRYGIMADPYVELLRAFVSMPLAGYSFESVFRLLHCVLLSSEESFDDRQLNELENYVIATGIHGKSSWKKEWTKTWKRPHPPKLEQVNGTREQVCARFISYMDMLESSSTVSARIEVLRAFIEAEGIEDRLEKLCERLAENDTPENRMLIDEYMQIPEFIADIFTRMQELIGDEVTGLKDFAELLELSFMELKVGLLPASMDCMLVGDVERSRIGDIKKLFFIGVNDGVIPAAAARSGIISDSDRMFFGENGIELSPTIREKTYTGEFYLYQNLTKPKNGIYISYSEKDGNDRAMMPSGLIADLKRMYEGLEAVPARTGDVPEYLLGSDGGVRMLRDTLRDLRAGWAEMKEPSPEMLEKTCILTQVVKLPEKERESILKDVFYKSREQKIREELARNLYGELSCSISRLETFAKCNFRHFLQYGLGLSERREFEISRADSGSLVHFALDLCGNILKEQGKKFSEQSDEELDALATAAVNEVADKYEVGLFRASKRREHITDILRDIVAKTLKITAFQLRDSDFEPEWYEKEFEYDNDGVKINGKVDRIDICEDDGRIYAKIVDYKSSAHDIDETEIESGLQFQLGIYASAVERMIKQKWPEKEYVPAAILYYKFGDPFVDITKKPDTDVEAAIINELRPKGRINASEDVVIKLDRELASEESETGLKPGTRSRRLPVYVKAEGVFDTATGKNLWTAEEFEHTARELDKKAREYADQILCGEAAANPVRNKKKSACEYCDFKDICAYGYVNGKRIRLIGSGENEGEDDGSED